MRPLILIYPLALLALLAPAPAFSKACEAVHDDITDMRLTIKGEIDRNNVFALSALISRVTAQQTETESKAAAIVDHLKLNPFIEGILPLPSLKSLSNALASGYQSTTEVASIIEDVIVTKRSTLRQRKISLQRTASRLEFIDMNSVTPISMETFDLFKVERAVSHRELFELLPRWDKTWPRIFEPRLKRRPSFVIYEVADFPGTFTLIFNDLQAMNIVFQRASIAIEEKRWPIRGKDLFGNIAIGHDLRGSDLIMYWKSLVADAKNAEMAFDHAEYRNRLKMEMEFFEKVVLPLIRERGENFVLLAAAADNDSHRVMTHEIWHAKYFTDPLFKKTCHDYWTALPKSDQDLFKSFAAKLMFDTNDEGLMVNEFQAYMLNDDPHFGSTPLEQLQEQMTRRLRPGFLEHLRRMGQ